MALRNPGFILLDYIKDWTSRNFKKRLTIPRNDSGSRYYRIATVDGIDANTGAGVTFKLSGVNDYTKTTRSTVWLSCVQRGNNVFNVEIHTIGTPIGVGKLVVGSIRKGDVEFELWLRVTGTVDQFDIEIDNANEEGKVVIHRVEEVTTEPTNFDVKLDVGDDDVNNQLTTVKGVGDNYAPLGYQGWGVGSYDDAMLLPSWDHQIPGNYFASIPSSYPSTEATPPDPPQEFVDKLKGKDFGVLIAGIPNKIGEPNNTEGDCVWHIHNKDSYYIRSSDRTDANGSPDWSPLKTVAYKEELDGQLPNNSKSLGSTTNLNSVLLPGIYHQTTNANTNNKNYPINRAGTLEVKYCSGFGESSAGIIQEYTVYFESQSSAPEVYLRQTSNGLTWRPWRKQASEKWVDDNFAKKDGSDVKIITHLPKVVLNEWNWWNNSTGKLEQRYIGKRVEMFKMSNEDYNDGWYIEHVNMSGYIFKDDNTNQTSLDNFGLRDGDVVTELVFDHRNGGATAPPLLIRGRSIYLARGDSYVFLNRFITGVAGGDLMLVPWVEDWSDTNRNVNKAFYVYAVLSITLRKP